MSESTHVGGPRARTPVPARPANPKPKVRADGSYALPAEDEKILQLVLDEGASTYGRNSLRLVGFGRLVLREVFGGDATAARKPLRYKRPLWLEIRRRAGGPTLRMNAHDISVCVRIAAWDHAITDEAWRDLDWNRKRILLPLADEKLLREAAQHVKQFKLDEEATRAHADALRRKHGKAPKTRLTPERVRTQARELIEKFRKGDAPRRVAEAAKKMSEPERATLERELEALEDLARELRLSVRQPR